MIKLSKLSYQPDTFGQITESRQIRNTTGQFFTGADGVRWCVAPSPRGRSCYPQLFFENPADGSYIYAAEVRGGLDDWRTRATKDTQHRDGTPTNWKIKINKLLTDFFGTNAGQY